MLKTPRHKYTILYICSESSVESKNVASNLISTSRITGSATSLRILLLNFRNDNSTLSNFQRFQKFTLRENDHRSSSIPLKMSPRSYIPINVEYRRSFEICMFTLSVLAELWKYGSSNFRSQRESSSHVPTWQHYAKLQYDLY